MISNEKQYILTKQKLEKWKQVLDQVIRHINSYPKATASWIWKERYQGVQEQIKQLETELKEYENQNSI